MNRPRLAILIAMLGGTATGTSLNDDDRTD